jgi:AbrB family looped-hinge helix DNA binding protein
MSISKISDKGLTTIPKRIRKKLNLKKGDKIHWIEYGIDRAIITVIHDPFKFLKGRHSKLNLKYEELEHEADNLLEREVH